MNIYLISQNVNVGYDTYDTYDTAVVIAESEQLARMTAPDGNKEWDGTKSTWSAWCAVDDVSAELIGVANDDAEPGIVCASFNAG